MTPRHADTAMIDNRTPAVALQTLYRVECHIHTNSQRHTLPPAHLGRPQASLQPQTNALRPVMARPTIRVLISRVPS